MKLETPDKILKNLAKPLDPPTLWPLECNDVSNPLNPKISGQIGNGKDENGSLRFVVGEITEGENKGKFIIRLGTYIKEDNGLLSSAFIGDLMASKRDIQNLCNQLKIAIK